jgi:hypothetical protein
MGNNQYIGVWEKYRPVINNLLKDGGGCYELSSVDFTQCGNRDCYSFSLTIVDCDIPINAGSAVARDLKTVLDSSVSFKKYASGKTVVIRLNSRFVLDVVIR